MLRRLPFRIIIGRKFLLFYVYGVNQVVVVVLISHLFSYVDNASLLKNIEHAQSGL